MLVLLVVLVLVLVVAVVAKGEAFVQQDLLVRDSNDMMLVTKELIEFYWCCYSY